jgi:nitroreductase
VVDFAAAEVTPPGAKIGEADLLGLLSTRRSGREYRPEPVSREHLEALMRAASLAPSAHNGRPVRAYVYTDPEQIRLIRTKVMAFYRKYARILRTPGLNLVGCHMGYKPRELRALAAALADLSDPAAKQDRLFYEAPALLAFGSRRTDAMTIADGWLAAANAAVYAETIPLGACVNGYLSSAANGSRSVREAMGLPRKEHIIAALTLGYPALKYARPAPRKTLPVTYH